MSHQGSWTNSVNPENEYYDKQLSLASFVRNPKEKLDQNKEASTICCVRHTKLLKLKLKNLLFFMVVIFVAQFH